MTSTHGDGKVFHAHSFRGKGAMHIGKVCVETPSRCIKIINVFRYQKKVRVVCSSSLETRAPIIATPAKFGNF